MNDNQRNFLINAKIDMNNVLQYTGDEATYHEILLDFREGLDEQFANVKNSINDIANYTILVHALKSNARTLGLTALADIAYKHEMAGKSNDVNFINQNMMLLENAVNNVKAFIDKYKTL